MVKNSMVSTNSSSIEEIEDFLCLSSEEEENDLCYWEFVNPSDADDDDIDIDVDFDNISLDTHENGLLVSSITIPPETQIQNTHFDDDQHQPQLACVGYVGYQYRDDDDGHDHGHGDEGMCGDDDDEEDDDMYDDDGDGYDLDDELVPKSVSKKLGRQRMRKLGKRGFARMYNSKKSPFLYTKPGCVHGKHGLGFKHSC